MFWLVTRALSMFGGSAAPQPSQKTLVVDDKVLWQSISESLRTMEQMEKFIDAEMVKIMKSEMANVSARAARATPPLNGGDMSKAEKNVEDDINYIFKPLESVPFASLVLARNWTGVAAYNYKFKSPKLQKDLDNGKFDAIYRAFANPQARAWGKYKEFDQDYLLLTGSPSKNQHRAGLDNRGRINGLRWHVTGTKDQAQAKIDTYVKFMQQGIGKMAGGWVKIFTMLQGTGWSLPLDWASKGRGSLKMQTDGPNKDITIENHFGNYGGFADQRYATFNYILQECASNGAKRYVDNCQETANRLNMN